MLTEMVEGDAGRRGRGRPTAVEAQARGMAIVSAAAALFEERGFSGVTMTEVARRARISKTTLYAAYADKDILFRAICSYACRVPADRIAAVETHGRDPGEVLADYGQAIAEATRDPAADRFLRLALFEAPRFPELARQILAESRAVSAPLAAWLAERAAAGGLAPGHDPVRLAEQFVALVTGGHAGLLEQLDPAVDDTRIAAALALVAPLLI